MSDQIKKQREFETFYQNYTQGNSSLSELYQNSESAKPSESLDNVILAVAKEQISKQESRESHPSSKVPLSNKPRLSSFYSLAASVSMFSLASLVIFNTWEAEKESVEKKYTDYAPAPLEFEPIALPSPVYQQELNDSIVAPRAKMSAETKASSADILLAEEELTIETKKDTVSLSTYSPQVKAIKALPAKNKRYRRAQKQEQGLERHLEKQAFIQEPLLELGIVSDDVIGGLSTEEKILAPNIWLNKIDQLITLKQIKKAKLELVLFRKTYPDFFIEPDLLKALQD